MSSVDACPFCNLDEQLLASNEHAMLFLSNPRKVECHVLVAPKRHIEKPWEVSGEELSAIFELIWLAQRTLVAEFGGGVDIRQNYRPFIKQGRIKVDHMHYHVLPCLPQGSSRQPADGRSQPQFTELTDDERARFTRLFIKQ